MISSLFKITFFFLFLSYSGSVLAEVWLNEKQWDEEAEADYSRWIKEEFQVDVFSNPESPYYGIKTDCADALLVARAIYSFEKKLPFSFLNIDKVIISNLSNQFDNFESHKRLYFFLNALGDQVNAESLASDNTYSIHPKDIRAGDFYIVKWINDKGKENRHAYLIKEIQPTGNFTLLSSTTPKAKRTLATRQGMPAHMFVNAPYGFRRFKERSFLASKNEDLTQYSWAKLGENEFYTRVKSLLKSEEDTYQKNFERRFANVCIALDVRWLVIEETARLRKERNGRCLTSSEFDEHSTPSRDKNLLAELQRIKNAWLTLTRQNNPHDLSLDEIQGLDFFIGKRSDSEGAKSLSNRCVVSFTLSSGKAVQMNLKSFFERLNNDLVSSNPNDSIEARYGLSSLSKVCLK